MMAGFAVGCFGAFQDVATDGMAIDIIPVEQQARANGFMWGAKIIGTSASLALGSWLLNKYNYQTSILMLSIAVGCIMFVPMLLRERPGEKFLPWSTGAASPETEKMQLGSWKVIFKSLYSVFRLHNSLLMALLLFLTQGAFNFVATLLPIFTVQSLGWTDQAYSQQYATASLIGGIVGMVAGGMLIEKFGSLRMIKIYFILLIGLTSLFIYLDNFWKATWYVAGFMMVYQTLYVFGCIGLFAIAMQCCWKKVSASQFTIYMTIGNLGRIAGAKLIGPLKNLLSWEYTILTFGGMMVIALIIIQFINIGHHIERVNLLDENS